MDTPRDPNPQLAAIILAAGYSSRMGQFKPLLPLDGATGYDPTAGKSSTAIEAVIHAFLSAGIPQVFVVCGHRAAELRPVVEAAGARCVLNPNFTLGMFSSVRAGIAALPADVQACFITPADIPLVRPATIRRMANALAANTSGASIVYPLFAQRRGHPTLISRAVLNEVTHAPADARLSTLLAAHQHQSIDIFVPDQAILMDMDTPGDFARLRDLAELRGTHPELPTPAECEAILAFYQPDERVVRHTHIVAQVARSIAIALAAHDAARGIPAQPALVEPALVEAAALLHDVLKRTANAHPDHATAGAELLRQLEFPKVAAVVALHTDYPLPQSALSASSAWLPDEAAIVYLADKLVSADRILGLEQRFLRAFERFQHDPAALASARRRLAVAEAIFHHVEAHLGAALQPLIDAITPAELNPGAPNPDSPNQSSNQPQETDATHLSRP